MKSLVGLRRSLTILGQATRARAAKESVEICPVELPGPAPSTLADWLEPAFQQQLAYCAGSLEAAVLGCFHSGEQPSKNGSGDAHLRECGRVAVPADARAAVRVVDFGGRDHSDPP